MAAQGGGNGRADLWQGRPNRQQGQADPFLRHVVELGDSNAAGNDQVRTQHEATNAENDIGQRARQAEFWRLFQFHAGIFARRNSLARHVESDNTISDQNGQKQNTAQYSQGAHSGQQDPDGCGNEHRRQRAALTVPTGDERHDQRRNPQDEKDVGNVGADNITERETSPVFQRSVQRHDHFGRRGTETDDEDTGNEGRYADASGNGNRAVYQEIPRKRHNNKPPDQGGDQG